MFDVTDISKEISNEIVFRRRALFDHFPYFINFAIGSPLGMDIPEVLATEMERALGLGINFEVRPEWRIPHFGFRHRRVKAQQQKFDTRKFEFMDEGQQLPEFINGTHHAPNKFLAAIDPSTNVNPAAFRWLDVSAVEKVKMRKQRC